MATITAALLRDIRTGFATNFQAGLGQAASQYMTIATMVPSSTGSNTYGFLGEFPGMREWIGDRVIQGMEEKDYRIVNKDWEQTVGVDRNDIEDDNLGIYASRFAGMGQAVAAHPDELCFGLLNDGWNNECYDGQAFFDTDHPVRDASGKEVSMSNTLGGNGTPWFLIDDRKPLKPVIMQMRKGAQFVALDSPDDPNVFHKKKFLYGYDGRWNVGFGYWQNCIGSRQELTEANLKAAHDMMTTMTGDYGRKLGLRGTLLVVPTTLQFVAKELLENERGPNGASNTMRGTSRLFIADWL